VDGKAVVGVRADPMVALAALALGIDVDHDGSQVR